MKERKLALVTEAENGLGIKFASILANEGFDVILTAKGTSYVQLAKMQLRRINLMEVDLTRSEGLESLKAHIKNTYGKLDVLINNAEIANGFGQKIDQLKIEEVKLLYDENFFSLISTTQALYPLMLAGENAKIVNISSALGEVDKMKDDGYMYADYKMTAYSTAKAALEMLTVLLSKEFKGTTLEITGFDPINNMQNEAGACETLKRELLAVLGIKPIIPYKISS